MTTWPVTSRAGGSLLVLAVAMALSGCSESGEPEPIPTVAASPTTATPTSTPSPSPTETVSHEQAAAERALDRFLQVEATLYANPDASPAALKRVSYGLALSQAENYLAQMRADGITQVGTTRTISREVVRLDLDDEPPTLVFAQCTDGSDVKVLQNGTPFTGSTTERNLTTFGVSYWEEKWQVSFIKLSGPNRC